MAKQNTVDKKKLEVSDETATSIEKIKPVSKKKVEKVIDVATFCDIMVPVELDKYVGKKKFPTERLTIKEWCSLFEKSGIPYKK